jgi:hypothetical protein
MDVKIGKVSNWFLRIVGPYDSVVLHGDEVGLGNTLFFLSFLCSLHYLFHVISFNVVVFFFFSVSMYCLGMAFRTDPVSAKQILWFLKNVLSLYPRIVSSSYLKIAVFLYAAMESSAQEIREYINMFLLFSLFIRIIHVFCILEYQRLMRKAMLNNYLSSPALFSGIYTVNGQLKTEQQLAYERASKTIRNDRLSSHAA